MSLITNDFQMGQFQDRLARIQKKGRRVELAPIGSGDAPATDAKSRKLKAEVEKRVQAGLAKAEPKLNPLGFLFAGLIGAAAVAVVRYVRYMYMPEAFPQALTGTQAAAMMGLDFVVALVFALWIKVILGARTRQFVAAETIGAGLMLMLMHNLVHAAPELWLSAFPQSWVSDVIASTDPHSVLIAGISFPL